MAILELLLLVIRAIQFLFAIIILGLTGHGEFIPTSLLELLLTRTSRLLWIHTLPGLFHDIRSRLDDLGRPLHRFDA